MSTDRQHVVIVGSGVGGLTCALSLIKSGHEVTVITKSRTSDSATWYAQGGVASAMFPDDTPESHIADTLTAGVDLCNVRAVEILVHNGPDAVRTLISRGAVFDTLADGSYARAREGGHHAHRIIHAGGDATGEEIERALVKAADEISLENLHIVDHHMLTKIVSDSNRCMGIEYVDAHGSVHFIDADHVVLATGGAGQLFAVTTNPVLATADGVAVALNAGVLCADLEFMQFHPTALHINNMPRPLLSEALRGEGAILRDENGVAFMQGVHELADLAPRDVVSREIAHVIHEHGIDHVWLDATNIKDFSVHFPTIFASCDAVGIDPTRDYLPVSPAAHYFCGGVMTDIDGATSMPHLWAAGEVACNGVHGANRLASNSLLDGLVFGERVASAIDAGRDGFQHEGMFASFETWSSTVMDMYRNPSISSDFPIHATDEEMALARSEIQRTMTQNVGVVRSADFLHAARRDIDAVCRSMNGDSTKEGDVFARYELAHLIRVATSMVKLALHREESRGCHTRMDFPDANPELVGHFLTNGNSAIGFVGENRAIEPLNYRHEFRRES